MAKLEIWKLSDAALYASLTGHLGIKQSFTANKQLPLELTIKAYQNGSSAIFNSSALVGIVAQRLVRKLCPDCKEAYTPSEHELKYIIANQDDYEAFANAKVYKTGWLLQLREYRASKQNRRLRSYADNERIKKSYNKSKRCS
ncbi:MAG: hypothetical protein MZV64_64895 [Ignavibacteriales bacterium]|nr:hypothetical protein [Ignavibacteriales bacterium]